MEPPAASPSTDTFDSILELLPHLVETTASIKESLLTNLIMIGEIPAPTFAEEQRVSFLQDRFNECYLENCSTDEKNNVFGVLPGTEKDSTLLLVAHTDTVFPVDVDHSTVVDESMIRGAGLGDDSLGLAALATLPTLLEAAGIRLQSDLLMMGASRSLGRGNLEGLRFFLANRPTPIRAGICVEGTLLGRLSYKSIGMVRGEIECNLPDVYDWTRFGAGSAILTLNTIIDRILEIPRPWRPRTSIALSRISGGSSFTSVATSANLQFEVRSESQDRAAEVWSQIEDICAEVASDTGASVDLFEFARREPGGIRFAHPLVGRTRSILDALSISPRIAPSTSELSALIDEDIPAVTVGIANGRRLNKINEALSIESMYTGMAQLVGVLLAIDGGYCDEG